MQWRTGIFVTVHGKYKTVYISNADTGHAKMSFSQTSYCHMPSTKSKLEYELYGRKI
jgi:hypothetical protein